MRRTAAAASRLPGWPLQRAERGAAGLPPFGASAARKAIGQPRRPQAPEAAEVPAVRAPDAPQVVGLREELLDGGGPRTGALATTVVVKARWCGWCAPSCRQEAERRNVGLWRPEAVRQSASPRIPQIATLHGRSDDRRAVAWRCGRCSCRAELHYCVASAELAMFVSRGKRSGSSKHIGRFRLSDPEIIVCGARDVREAAILVQVGMHMRNAAFEHGPGC